MKIAWGRLSAALSSVLVGAVLTAVPASAADPVTIQLFDINDFHGRIDANTVKFAGTVEQLRAQAGEGKSLFLSAGDNIGASLFASATQKDEPTIDVLNALGLDVSVVGNHEFDKGADDLTGRVTARAKFPYIAANVIDKTTGKTLLPAYKTFTVGGLKVAVIGAVTQETPSLVTPGGIANLQFTNPVEAVNKTAAELNASADKPDVIVADYHEGAGAGTPDGATIDQEIAAGGAFADIATKTDASVDAIFTGHTHKQYAWDAPVPGQPGKTRPILQTGSYGENIGNIGLTVNPDNDEVTAYTVKNVARTTTADATLVSQYPRVAAVKPIVDAALSNAATVGQRPVGEVTDDITTAYIGSSRDDRASESTLGNLVSDAVLAQVKSTTAGADLAVTNPGGLRNELFFKGAGGTDKDGVVTYAEANAVLPFVNNLSSVTLSGASLKKVFEQQWQTNPDGSVPSRPYLQLGTSSNVRYTYDDSRAAGDRITSLWVNDKPISATASYKVAVPSFLVSGGDNFRAFTEGKGVDTGLVDYEAWIDYLEKNQPLSPSFARHAVKATGVKSVYRPGAALSVSLGKLNLTSLGSPANKSVSAKVTKAGTVVKSLGSTAVTDGNATVAGDLPAGVTGDLLLDVTAYPSGTHTTIPLSVKGASISATADDAVFGDSTKVHVTATAPGAAPTGAVRVLQGSTELGTGTLDDDGTADVTIDTKALGAGTSTLTVAYAGAGDLPAAAGSVTVSVQKAATTSTVQVEPNPRRGEPVDVTVDVDSATGTTPTGAVTLTAGDTVLGTGTLDQGSATVAADASSLPIGTTSITAEYEGDANHAASSTAADVDLAKGIVNLAASAPAATPYGTSAKILVSGAKDARGLVYVTSGSDVVGIGVLSDGQGAVTLDATALKPGAHDLHVLFNGSEQFEPTDVPVSLTVTKAPTVTKAKVTTAKVVQSKTKAKVSVTVSAAGFAPTGGTVTVKKGSTLLGSGTLTSGSATITLRAFAKLGTANLTVTYAGNELALGSSGTTSLKVVKK